MALCANPWNWPSLVSPFRNPSSPKYRPRANKGDKAPTQPWESKTAAVVRAADGSDPLEYWTKPEKVDDHAAAVKNAGSTPESSGVPTMRMKLTMKHPLNKQTYTVLLDSGTTTSLVAKEVVSWYKPKGEGMTYRDVNGAAHHTTGSIQLPFVLPEFSVHRECTQTCEIAGDLVYPIILGNDFLQMQGMELDYKRKGIRWDGLTAKMCVTPEPPLRVAFAVQDNNERVMKVLDVTGKEIDLEKLVPKDHLEPEQRQRLLGILKSFKISEVHGIGRLKRAPYVLPVKPGSRPYVQRPYPIPLIHREAVFREVERLVQLGVIEVDKDSPWAAPCFVIAKKDGSVRFLTDFRGLNRCLERRYYPLNGTQSLVRELPKPAFISALDLTMGYYSRELAEESRPYTAIVLPWGKYRYRRLPMGISSAPDEFQAVMQQVLGDLLFARVYLDDVLVLSNSFEEHLVHLEEVLRRLQDASLVLNARKCKFCMTEVEYLGFHLSTDGKKPIQKKIDAIVHLGRPRNIRDLRRFVGMINYYKDTWQGRSETLAPLTALTSVKRPFQWTEREQNAFDAAKRMITKDVMLAYPDFDATFDLYTDASEQQLGGVIMQLGRPLAFWSRKCTGSQRQYTMNKKELLSVLEMLREFRSILWGRRIRVFTDHKNSVQATFNNPQMLRWRLEIEEYGPEMIYIKGHDNVVADALSRLPLQGDEAAASVATNARNPVWPLSLVEIAEAQQQSGLHEGPQVARRAIGSTKVLVSKANGRILLPPALINKVLHTYHEWLVHPGELTMLESVKAALTWPGMTESVRQWVRNCEQCARSKSRAGKFGKLPTKTVEVRPWRKSPSILWALWKVDSGEL
ncbi:hypothetical protein PF008_g29360 [Phytophthora fragariae]|uniref:Reverse transcriptase domain-containing protein n=1 Tax=Phytophthora fragariae TaxID=53985 RepID=A0A6G0Q9G6_9STRA|nr:hypothetical protein PF008_g29360 [Phytophthora fragariae]